MVSLIYISCLHLFSCASCSVSYCIAAHFHSLGSDGPWLASPCLSPSSLLPSFCPITVVMGAPLTWALVEVYYTFLKMLLTVQLMSLYLEQLWDGYTSCPGPRPVWVDIYGSKNRAFVYLLGERGTFYVFSPWSWEWFFLKKVKKWHGTVCFCWCSLLAHLCACLLGGEPCRGHVSLNRGICITSKSLGETWFL